LSHIGSIREWKTRLIPTSITFAAALCNSRTPAIGGLLCSQID
jgi:hypothetical protein